MHEDGDGARAHHVGRNPGPCVQEAEYAFRSMGPQQFGAYATHDYVVERAREDPDDSGCPGRTMDASGTVCDRSRESVAPSLRARSPTNLAAFMRHAAIAGGPSR